MLPGKQPGSPAMTPHIRLAEFPEDREAVIGLFSDYVAHLLERVPDEREAIARKYDPAGVAAAVDGFARVHARPHGALLIATSGGAPVGCGMMRTQAPGAAELQRIFVRPEARGTGLGRAITEALMDQARSDGHRVVRLDTGRTMTEVIDFYARLGFAEVPPYHDETPYLNHTLIFMERPL